MKKLQNKAWLFANAKVIANELKLRGEGTNLRIRLPRRATTTNTGGWRVEIGDLGKGKPRLEIWFDRFTGYSDRKLWAGFYSPDKRKIKSIADRVAKTLRPHRVITEEDLSDDKYVSLHQRLRRAEFNVPLQEKYSANSFYGVYNPTRNISQKVNANFCNWAAAFLESVARELPSATAESEEHEIYPQIENRKTVTSHLQRERSRLLATECKIRDDYKCQVCGMKFERIYGSIGKNFAEAHHLVPLAKLKRETKTHVKDLTTVCANCHRMLHKLDGNRDDVRKLKRLRKLA